ncbi:MAG: PD-(D/E)XK nuclease family protein, partial [Hyphomicrobium sp.]|nr:PD-(D/E)XK nuclease family protein [Hyphomicrobium sp.]
LALKMQRLQAARAGAVGVEIFSLPQLAARLAGGFARLATSEEVQPAIRAALEQGGFAELQNLTQLPGMVRAVQQTLGAAWCSDTVLDGSVNRRLADLALIDGVVRSNLAPGVFTPPDLRDKALARIAHARRLLGSVEIVGLLDIDPVWRPLVTALAEQTHVTWTAAGATDRRWFKGAVSPPPVAPPITPVAFVCANPQAEVVEALR